MLRCNCTNPHFLLHCWLTFRMNISISLPSTIPSSTYFFFRMRNHSYGGIYRRWIQSQNFQVKSLNFLPYYMRFLFAPFYLFISFILLFTAYSWRKPLLSLNYVIHLFNYYNKFFYVSVLMSSVFLHKQCRPVGVVVCAT